jgi:hypothetical protein
MALVFCLLGCCAARSDEICEKVKEIREIPAKGEGRDAAYLALMEAGVEAIPCLIERVTETTAADDPRMAPTYSGMVVGDVAVFMILEITGTDLPLFLPDDVREDFEVRGVYAYFEYVRKPAHRRELQARIRDWWQGQRMREIE